MRYLILILILFCNTLLHSQWVQQSSGSSQLICVSAPNDTIVWASGAYTGSGGGSIVLRTTNGGIKWEQVAILNTYPVQVL